MKIRCVVACVNSTGARDFFGVEVHCTRQEYENGDHYDQAESQARASDYEDPMVVFDEQDGPPWLFEKIFGAATEEILEINSSPPIPNPDPPAPVTYEQVSIARMAAGNEKQIKKVIWNNRLMVWVAIGWVEEREANETDRGIYPTVMG